MKKNNKLVQKRLPIIIFLLATSVLQTYADENRTRPPFPAPSMSYETSFLADGNIAEANVKVYKNQLQLTKDFFSLGYTHWKFDWDNISSLPFGDRINNPIDEAQALQGSVRYRQRIDDQWSYMTLLSLKSTFEKQLSDSFGLNLLAFTSYNVGDGHAFQMGGFANYHPTRTLILPALSYSYRERSKDGLQAIIGFPRTHIGYYIDEKSLLRIGILFSQSLVRLSNESVIEKGGYVEAKDYLSNIGFTHQINKDFTLKGDLLYSLKRDFTIFDANARETQKHSIGNALGASLNVIYSF